MSHDVTLLKVMLGTNADANMATALSKLVISELSSDNTGIMDFSCCPKGWN